MAERQSTEPARAVIEQLLRLVRSVRYGMVQLTIHDGRVVQIEKSEKIRLSADLTAGCPQELVPDDRTSGAHGLGGATTPQE